MAKRKSPRRKSKKTLSRRRKSIKPINFKRELSAGIKVEMEHTKHIRSKKSARKIAAKIAMDHLRETPQYYRRLKKCFPEEHHNNPGAPGMSHMVAPFRANHGKGILHDYVKSRLGDASSNPKSTKNYISKELMPDWRKKIDSRSIRTKVVKTKSGGKRLIRLGCPKGQWKPKGKRCKVGTKAISILTPKSEKILKLHGVAAARRAAGNPDKKFWREQAIRTTGHLRKCLASHRGDKNTVDSLQKGSSRMESLLKRLAAHEDAVEHRTRIGRNPSGRLTFKEAKRQIPVGFVMIKDEAGDYIIKRLGSPASEWYYTNDLHDAVGTAKDMAKRSSSTNPNEISPAYRTFGYGRPGRIHAGMKVKVAGSGKRGRVVMPSSLPGYWVLNMGGPHGTPKVVHEDNIITRGVGENPGKVAVVPFSETTGCLSAKRFLGSCNECTRVASCKLAQSAGGRLRVSEDTVLRKQKAVDEAMKELARAKEERDHRAQEAKKNK